MARPNRHLNVDHVEQLIAERDLAIKDIARKMARARHRRTANEKEVEKERRSLQRWLGGGGIEPKNQRLLAIALEADPEELLLPQPVAQSKGVTQPAPIAVMQEALANQEKMMVWQNEVTGRLEALEDAASEIADGVRRTLALLRDDQAPGQAGRG